MARVGGVILNGVYVCANQKCEINGGVILRFRVLGGVAAYAKLSYDHAKLRKAA
jgi:hypothetical protein